LSARFLLRDACGLPSGEVFYSFSIEKARHECRAFCLTFDTALYQAALARLRST
jgi:hypothetical protein